MHGRHQQQQGQGQGAAVAPKGCVTVRVGADGEEQRRFAVPLGHLKHPLFGALLEEAEREYGFRQQGAIAIPCPVDRFVHVERLIDQDLHGAHHLVDLDAAAAHHHQSQIHLHLPRFADCFRA
ncbi:auxin-responsive protein SAUR32-like [Oryza brachyantha]|uniref:auxin-responsive protein SAUR32-like n=1 Tax=Oryza brachyantha TaxID=4533 RepID=UPI001ADAF829|nr:auxin-responsive protein SAUR32-like [Oryza brachyantha]